MNYRILIIPFIVLIYHSSVAFSASDFYDDFSGNNIDSAKWLNCQRGKIENGKLLLDQYGSNYWAFADCDVIEKNITNYISSLVSISSDSYTNLNSSVRVKVGGIYYNDTFNKSTGYDNFTGNIDAQISLRLYKGQLSAIAVVARYSNSSGTNFTYRYGIFNQSIKFNTEYLLSVEFTGSQFIFKCNEETMVYNITTPVYPTNKLNRQIGETVASDRGESGYVKGTFDDVCLAKECSRPFPGPALLLLLSDESPVGDPVPLSTVTVSATDSLASESGGTGTFRINRSGGSTSSNLTVYHTMEGTADTGIDYGFITGSTIIPAGQVYRDIILSPINDSNYEVSETATLTIMNNNSYTRGNPYQATVTIADNDPVDGIHRDQGQIFNTGGTLQLGTYEWSQSITSGIPGQLTDIEIQFYKGVPEQPIALTLSLFSGGNPISGDASFSEELFIKSSDLAGGLFNWDVSNACLILKSGDVFTFVLQADKDGYDIAGNDPPGYTRGELFRNRQEYVELSDIAFRTYVKSNPDCL